MSDKKPIMIKQKLNHHLLWVSFITLTIPLYSFVGGEITNDVKNFYQNVFNEALQGTIYGLNTGWVYPVGALIPIMIAGVLGLLVGNYLTGWIILVMVSVFIGSFTVGRKHGFTYKHYLVVLLVSLAVSGVFYYRLDIFAVLLTIVAVLISGKHKQLAYFILVVGVFIKIWPFAVLFALWVMSSRKLYDIVNIVGYAVIVMSPSLILGGWGVPFSFLSTHGSRGVQVESLFAIPLFLQGSQGYYNDDIIVYEVSGVGVELFSSLSTVLLVVLLMAVTVVGFSKYWVKPASRAEAYSLANVILIGFVLFNKVGSTHFVLWLMLALFFTVFYVKPDKQYQHVMSMLLVAVSAGILYPYFIAHLMVGKSYMISLLVLKQFMTIVMLGLNIRDYLNSSKADRVEGIKA